MGFAAFFVAKNHGYILNSEIHRL